MNHFLTGESLPVMKTIEVDKDLNENDFMKTLSMLELL